jgi:hypothetical protein
MAREFNSTEIDYSVTIDGKRYEGKQPTISDLKRHTKIERFYGEANTDQVFDLALEAMAAMWPGMPADTMKKLQVYTYLMGVYNELMTETFLARGKKKDESLSTSLEDLSTPPSES